MANTVQLTKNGQPVFPVTDESLVTGLNYRPYDSQNPNGMGYLVLKKDKTFAEQVTDTNTIYEIRYDFNLNTASATIPAGCVLKFNGGSLSNGTLVGNGTGIEYNGCIFDNITISGSWLVEEIRSSMFKDLSNNGLRHLFALQNDSIFNRIIVEDGEYVVGFSADYGGAPALIISNNTDCEINGTISLDTEQRSQAMLTQGYRMIICHSNVKVHGSGHLVGDKSIHGQETESGHGLYVANYTNVELCGLTLSDFAGDGIGVSSEGGHIYIHDVEITNWNRNAISVVNAEKVTISGIYAHDGGFTSPSSIVDIEPNTGQNVSSVVIYGVVADNVGAGFQVLGEYGDIHNVLIRNATVTGCRSKALICQGFRGVDNLDVVDVSFTDFPADHPYAAAGDIVTMWVYRNVKLERVELDVTAITTKTSYGCIFGGNNVVFDACSFIGNNMFSQQIKSAKFDNCLFEGDYPFWPTASQTYGDIIINGCRFKTGQIELRNRNLIVENCAFIIASFNNTTYGVIRLNNGSGEQSKMIFCKNTILVTSTQTPAAKDYLLTTGGPNIICSENVFDNQGGGAGGGIYVNGDGGEYINNRFPNFGVSKRKIVINNANNLISLPVPKAGASANRPTLQSDYYFGGSVGTTFFDTTLGKVIVWNGTAWVNMDGSALS